MKAQSGQNMESVKLAVLLRSSNLDVSDGVLVMLTDRPLHETRRAKACIYLAPVYVFQDRIGLAVMFNDYKPCRFVETVTIEYQEEQEFCFVE